MGAQWDIELNLGPFVIHLVNFSGRGLFSLTDHIFAEVNIPELNFLFS